MSKAKIVAREWLYFLGCLFIGTVPLPMAILVISSIPADEFLGHYCIFWKDLVRPEAEAFWIAIGPYMLLQLIRSIIWAVRALRRTE